MRERLRRSLRALFGIGPRLLVVNLVVLLVPLAGIEFARLYERRLLEALERDMKHQAVIVAELARLDATRGKALDDPTHEPVLRVIARETRSRLRILGLHAEVLVDSHAHGAPEGPERAAPETSWLDLGSARRARPSPATAARRSRACASARPP